MSPEPFKRDYGYLHIITPEDKAKYGPKLKTDEYWHEMNGRWAAPNNDGSFGPHPYRRPISPGLNFELVPLDGVIENGCQYTSDGIRWVSISVTGPFSMRDYVVTYPVAAVRRPIPKPVEQGGWVSCATKLPQPYVLVIVAGGVARWTGAKWLSETAGDSGRTIQWEVTHWMELPKLPEPPQPPRPAAEVACDDAWTKQNGFPIKATPQEIFQAGFNAAIEWAKSNKGEL